MHPRRITCLLGCPVLEGVLLRQHVLLGISPALSADLFVRRNCNNTQHFFVEILESFCKVPLAHFKSAATMAQRSFNGLKH